MAEQTDDGSAAGIDVLPLEIGTGTYAVKLPRVATVLRTGVLEDVDDGDVIELSEHSVAIDAAAEFLGETPRNEEAVVVFHGKDDTGCVPGWLVDDVGDPTTVDRVDATVGAMHAVRGRVSIRGEDAVLLDPARLDAR